MSKKKTATKSASKFRKGLIIYICVFMFIVIIGMVLFWFYMKEYETSRPIHTMEKYVAELDSDYSKKVLETNAASMQMNAYETAESIQALTQNASDTPAEYSFVKYGTIYTDEKPAYKIQANKEPVAEVTLNQTGETKLFHFPVWTVNAPQPCKGGALSPKYNLDVIIPSNAVLMINGVPAQDTDIQEEVPVGNLCAAALNTIAQPTNRHYVIKDFYQQPTVQAQLLNGEPMDSILPIPDEKTKTQKYNFSNSKSILLEAEQSDYIKALCKSYIQFIINEKLQTVKNFDLFAKYLAKDCSIYTQFKKMRGEISFNNEYTAREDKVLTAENFVWLSDECFTADTHFEYSLTRNSRKNEYNNTIRWTMILTPEGWKASDLEMIQDDAADTQKTADAT